MKIKEVYNKGKEILSINNIEDSNIKARILICYTLKISKEDLVIKKEENMQENDEHIFFDYIDKVKNGFPVQYITNIQEFMKLNFYVDENVLIPQPDTEVLVENVINKSINNHPKILDLCTGSGAIAISLAKYIESSEIIASDISISALNVAKKNAENNDVKIKFIESDMFEKILDKNFDIIVSNPPYIKDCVINNLSAEVKNEPVIALSGGEDGLKFYKIIINEAYKYLKNDGYLCFEIGYDQKEDIIKIIKNNTNYELVECIKDLNQLDRVIVVRKVGK